MKGLENTFIICNPAAAGGRAYRRWKRFLRRLEERGLKVPYRLTKRPAEAEEIAAAAIESGFSRIAVFGGDGTLNEVLQAVALTGEFKPTIVFLCGGSSCDFQKGIATSQDPLERLLAEEERLIDVASVEYQDFSGKRKVRYFLANSSTGVLSQAVHRFNIAPFPVSLFKRVSIDLAALAAGVATLAKFSPFRARIKTDGKIFEMALSNITVFKSSYFGGGMNYGVKTERDDGLLHVALIERTARGKLFSLIPSLYTGKILSRGPAHYFTCNNLELQSSDSVVVETDGEIIGRPPLRYSLLRKKLRVVV